MYFGEYGNGSTLYGWHFYDTATSADRVTILGNGNVGIGTTTPVVSLDLSKESDAIALPVGTNSGRPTGLNLASGEIRYNTATPAVEYYNGTTWVPLDSSGSSIGSGLVLGTSLTALNPTRNGDPTTGLYSANAGEVDIAGSGVQTAAFTGTGITINGQLAETFGLFRETTAATAGNNLTLQAGGAVSLGTNKNGGNLILASGIATGTGSSNIQFNTYNAGSTGTADDTAFTALTLSATGATGVSPVTTLQANNGSGTNQNGGTLTLASGVSTGTGTSAINFNVYTAGSTGATANSATTAMTIGTNGFVGIGTVSPQAALDVNGAIDIKGVNGISFPPDYATDASIAIGSGALASQTASGSALQANTAIGYQALGSSGLTTAAKDNVAVGVTALAGNTSGKYNTAVGAGALGANSSGANNVAFGTGALSGNTTAGGNSAFGTNALQIGTSGQYNTAMGGGALSALTTGSYNTAIGASVGGTNLATGSNNIMIGVGTVGTAGGADTPLSSTSNYLNIGNTIEGTMANANAINRETLYLNSVASSVNYIQLSGGATGTGPTIAAAGTDTNVNLTISPQGTGNTLIPTGSVGIGTASPSSTLQIGSSGSDNVAFNAASDTIATFGWNGTNRVVISNNGFSSFGAAVDPSGYGTLQLGSGSNVSYIVGGSSLKLNPSGGNVGIGTTSPSWPLDVQDTAGNNVLQFTTYKPGTLATSGATFGGRRAEGTALAPTAVSANDVLTGFYGSGYTSASAFSGNTAAIRMWAAESYTATANGTYITFETTPTSSTGRTERMRIDSTGLIGIGSTSPLVSLDLSQEHDAIALPVGTNGNRPTTVNLASGEIRYNTATPAVEYYNGTTWVPLDSSGSSIGSGLVLGTSLTALNPTRNGDPTTGLYSANAGEVDIAGSGVQTAAFTGTGITINGQLAETFGLFRETTAATAGNNLTLQAGGAVSLGTNKNGGNLILASGIATGTGSSNIQFNTYNAGSTGTADDTAFTALTLSATGATGVSPVTTLQANNGSGTNQNGGTLTLASGVSTGTGTSAINFNVYTAGSTGATANSATTAMTIGTNGFVGIGSTTPVVSLDLSQKSDAIALPIGTNGTRPTSTALASGEIRYNSATPAVEYYNGTSWISLQTSGGAGTVNSGTQYQMAYYSATGNAVSGDASVTTDATNDFLITSGNLAIGTTAVTNAITLTGQTAETVGMIREITASTAGNNLTLQAGGAVSAGTNLSGGNLILASGVSTGTGSSNIQFQTYNAGSTGTTDNAALTALTLSATGTSGTNAITTLQANAGSGTNQNGGTLTLASGVSTGTGTSNINFNVYGAGSTGATANSATTAMTVASTGYVGIGTTSPAQLLDVGTSGAGGSGQVANFGNAGGGQSNYIGLNSGRAFVGYNGADSDLVLQALTTGGAARGIEFNVNSTTLGSGQAMVIGSTGNVGIGTTAPVVSLDLSKESDAIALPVGTNSGRPTGLNLASGEIRYNTATPAVEYYNGTSWISLQTSGGAGSVNSGTQYQMAYYSATGASVSGDANVTTDASNDFLITSGNLAIGTTAVTNAVTITGQAAETVGMVRETTAATAGNNLTVQAGGAVSVGTNLNGGNLILASGIATGTGSSNIQFNTYNSGTTGTADDSAFTALTLSATGTTGVSPVTTLQANNGSGTNQNGGTLTLASGVSTGTGTSNINFNVYGAGSTGPAANSATTAMTIASTGYVGIGTTSPASTLSVNGGLAIGTTYAGTNGAGSNNLIVQGNVGVGTTSPAGSSQFQIYNPSAAAVMYITAGTTNAAQIEMGSTTTPTSGLISYSNAASSLTFNTNSVGRVIINASGYVGIGTTTGSAVTSLLQTYDSVTKGVSYTSALIGAFDTSSTSSVNKVGLDVESTGSWTGTGAVNTALVVNATGGTTNYAATFNGGNVGIGTTTPVVSLDLSKESDAIALPVGTNSGRPTGLNLASGEIRYNTATPAVEYYNGTTWVPLDSSGSSIGSGLVLGTSLTALNPTRNGDPTTGLYSANAGEVDIAGSGVQTAAFTGTGITINGQLAETFGLFRETTAATAGNNLTLQAGGAVSLGTNKNGGNLILASGIATGTGSSNIQFNTYNAGSTGTADDTAFTALTLSATGATGVSPVTTLQANNGSGTNQNGGTLTLASGVSTGTGTSAINFNVYTAGSTGATANSATTAMTIGTNGFVGIGTVSPQAALDVNGAIDIKGVNGISFPPDYATDASIAIGSGALASQTASGSALQANTAIGYQALGSSGLTTAAKDNVAVGVTALAGNTSGKYNTAVGAGALGANSSGANNVAFGTGALSGNTTAGGNSAFGTNALQIGTSGQYNTAMGGGALSALTTGSYNTAIGASVGGTNLATGSNNIMIGVGTVGTAGGADTPLSSTSNYLNIGNTIEGTMANANAINRETLYLNSVASSVNYIQLSGGATGTGPTIAAAGTDTNVNLTLSPQGTGNILIPTGSLGIGTTTPVVSLDLSKESDAIALPVGTGSNRPTGLNLASGEIRYNTATPAVEYYNGTSWISLLSSGGSSGSVLGTSVTTPNPYGSATDTTTGLYTTGAGHVDVTVTGVQEMDWSSAGESLSGQAAQTISMFRETTAATAGNNLTLQAGGAVSLGTNKNGGNLILASGIATGTGSSNIQFNTYNAGSTGTADDTAFTALTLSATGATGVSPVTTLQANNGSGTNQNGGTLTLASGISTGTGTSGMNFNIYKAGSTGATANSATTAMTIGTNGFVGIGTLTPGSLFTTYDSAAKTAAYTGVLHSILDTSSTASVNKVGMDIESTGTWTGTSAVNTGLVVNATGGTTNYAATFNGGNVGIGTTLPGALLEVNGGSTASTNLEIDSSATTAGPYLDLLSTATGGHNWQIISDQTGNGGGAGALEIYDQTANASRLFIGTSGNMGINVTPSATNPFIVGSTSSNGNGAYLSPAGVWTNVSDRRLKENVRPISYGLDAVMKLRPVAYDMIGSHDEQVGFIAQDVLKIVPEVVGVPKNPETEHYGLSYGNMVAVTVKALQELKALFDKDHGLLVKLHHLFDADHAEIEKLKAANDNQAKSIDELRDMMLKQQQDFDEYKKAHP